MCYESFAMKLRWVFTCVPNGKWGVTAIMYDHGRVTYDWGDNFKIMCNVPESWLEIHRIHRSGCCTSVKPGVIRVWCEVMMLVLASCWLCDLTLHYFSALFFHFSCNLQPNLILRASAVFSGKLINNTHTYIHTYTP